MVFGLYYYVNYRLVSLPLLNVSAQASIKELAAQVKLTQTYGNDASFPIEAVYAFPVPARAAVCSFVMIKQDGTRVVGQVQEKGEARATYNTAVAEGRQASLMEQQTPDVFNVSVGNIPPNEQVKIELVYATELSEDEENDSVRFHLPVHIGARYGQAPTPVLSPRNPFASPIAARFFPASSSPRNAYFTQTSSPFLNITMSVESIAPISKIGCPSHAVSTELGPDPTLPNFKELPFSNYARVSLSSNSPLDKDFVLTIKSAGLDAPRCVAELHPAPAHDTVAMALTFVPRFKLPDLARQEFIFIVDRSGSMEDARIAAARKALVVMLRSLPHKDSLFQIMSFGSWTNSLWEAGSKPYNQETLEQATVHVDKMQADYGGTEIRGALQQCFKARKLDRPTSVFVLTDGEAWDLKEVLAVVKTAVAAAPESAPLRVSVLGIGDSVSTAMCEGIARVGHGTCMLVGEQEASFTGKIARLLKASKSPVIANISVDWGRPPVEVKASESEDDFEMVDEVEGPQKKKTLNVFDEAVDPIHVDDTPAPPPPPVILPAPSAVQQSPLKIRNLFPGVRLNIYAILQGRNVPKTVVLRGSTADGAEIELPIPVTLSHLQNDPGAPTALHALAARKIIQDLEDGQHGLTNTLSNPDDTDLLARTVKASIVRLGKTYSISSKHTSFVAVDELTPVPASPVPVEPSSPRYSPTRAEAPAPAQRSYARYSPPPPLPSPAAPSAPPPPPPPPAPSGRRRPPPPPPSRAAPLLSFIQASKPDLSSYNYSAISSLVLTTDRSSFPAATSAPRNGGDLTSALSSALQMRSETIDDWDNIKEADGDDSSDDGAVIESRQRVATVLFSADNASVTRRGRPAPSASAPAPESIQIVTTTSYEQGFGNARKEKMDDEAEDLFGSVHRHSDSLGLSSNVREASASKLSAPPSDPLEHLARLQSFDGCFSPAVFAFAGIDVQMLRVMFPAGAGDGIIATVLAMAFLSTKLGADVDRESWEGMYEKAKEYVEEALMGISANESVDWLEAEVVKMLA